MPLILKLYVRHRQMNATWSKEHKVMKIVCTLLDKLALPEIIPGVTGQKRPLTVEEAPATLK